MNRGIAYILMQHLTDIPYIQRFAGLVSLQEETNQDYESEQPATKFTKKYPVAYDYCITKPQECEIEGALSMIPDSSYFGQIYFEDGGVDPSGRQGRLYMYTSKLRMVVWLNTKMIVKKDEYTALPGQSISTAVLNDCLSRFNKIEFTNQGYYSRFKVKAKNIPISGDNVFSPYSFDKEANQYTMPPYEFFAVDLEVEYGLAEGCIDAITVSVADLGCGEPNPTPTPTQYPALNNLMPYTVNLTVGTDTDTGEVITPNENILDLTKVEILGGVILGGVVYQAVPLNEDGTGWDFKNHAGTVEQGIITVVVRKKIA